MAKEQMIKVFKEGNKMYVVIDNPSKETETKLNALFGNVAGDLASILKPQITSTKEQAADIDAIVESAYDAVPEILPEKEPETVTESSNNSEWFDKTFVEPEQKKEPKKEEWPVIMDRSVAKQIVTRMLQEKEYVNDTNVKRKLMYVLYCGSKKMRDMILKMPENQIEDAWVKQNILNLAASFSGFKPNNEEPKKEIEWV